jgi:hypothetical protein
VTFVANKESSRRKSLTNLFRSRNARFWAVVIAALSIGALFAGSQIARNWGQDVNWYTGFGQWLGALGSFAAAAAALWIATTDRRVRERELLAADEAQARLVIVQPQTSRHSGGLRYSMLFHNYGSRPILNVRLAKIELRAYPDAVAAYEDRTDLLVRAEEATGSPLVSFSDVGGSPLPAPVMTADQQIQWPDTNELGLVGWIAFSDAMGNRWAKSNTDELRRIRTDDELG